MYTIASGNRGHSLFIRRSNIPELAYLKNFFRLNYWPLNFSSCFAPLMLHNIIVLSRRLLAVFAADFFLICVLSSITLVNQVNHYRTILKDGQLLYLSRLNCFLTKLILNLFLTHFYYYLEIEEADELLPSMSCWDDRWTCCCAAGTLHWLVHLG